MKTESLVRNAKVALRSETIIADIHMRSLLARSGLQVVAGLIGLFGLVMLGIAAYLALEVTYGSIVAALIVGVGALVLAGILLWVASMLRPGRDLEVARQLRDAAGEAVIADLKSLETDVTGFARVFRNPLDGALPGLIIPLAGMLLKSMRGKPSGGKDGD